MTHRDTPEDSEPHRQAPVDLKARGAALWAAITETYELSARELEMLADACAHADVVDDVQAALYAHGPVVSGSMGQPRPNGLLEELRLSRLALARMLAALDLPEVDDQTVQDPERQRRSEAARKAAYARWGTGPEAGGSRRGASA